MAQIFCQVRIGLNFTNHVNYVKTAVQVVGQPRVSAKCETLIAWVAGWVQQLEVVSKYGLKWFPCHHIYVSIAVARVRLHYHRLRDVAG